MSDKVRELTVVLAAAVFLFGFALWSALKPAGEMSENERRKLAQMPEIKSETLLNGKFMSAFENYTMDQFPLRDQFRTVKALSTFYLFNQKDMNDIYIKNGYASKLEYPLSYDSLDNAVKKLTKINDKYLAETGNQVYFSVIPDKNYFLAEQNGYPAMDYNELASYLQQNLTFATYIDITECLTLEDYYQTDTHWRQEKIEAVAEKLASGMENPIHAEYEVKELERPFYGVYYGQSALPLPAEKIYYLENETLRNCEVFDYETNQLISVYDMKKAEGKDPYELFLSGPKSLLQIKNPSATTGKRLILFRDSFGSSLAPLLVEGYEEIIMIDIRYLSGEMLGRLVDFQDSDVLFLYSSLVLNNSVTLK